MTTFTLTTGQNLFNGSAGTDIFQGPGGGSDSLKGNAGNDFFSIQIGQTGLIDGGSGDDTLFMVGSTNNEFDLGLQIIGVEQLIVDAPSLLATAAQLKGFTHIGVSNSFSDFELSLQGAGGSLNFSASYTEPQDLLVNAELTTSAVKIVGSTHNDEIIGSDFNDTLNGDKGADVVRGGAGNDVVNGGLGNDTLFGDDGRDQFLFDTALGGNLDHLGDFRPVDDTIRIDDDIFSWAGQVTGALQATNFKVLGTGQTQDADDHILYNQNTGIIYYDVDGAGGLALRAFAVADNFAGDVPVLTFRDFTIVA
jgi:Ca2+-binding RTX toxin-like protein